MAYETIFSTPLGQLVLVFLLVFTLIFAVLQKSKILGEGKKQMDALVALAIGLIVISVGSVLDFLQQIIPFLAIALIILLVFLILLGMVFNEKTFEVMPWLKYVFGVAILIAVTVAVLIFTKGWDYITSWFGSNNSWGSNIVLIAVIVVAMIIAFFGSGKKDK